MACELIQQDRDPVYAAALLEVSLDLLGRCAIVDIAHEDASPINILSVLAQVVAFGIQVRLHLAQLCSFLFHFERSALHGIEILRAR